VCCIPIDSLGNLGPKTAYERVHRGVMWALWHHDTPGIVSLNRLHVLALFELNTLLYGSNRSREIEPLKPLVFMTVHHAK
jgi:hypothetical protein